LKGTILGGLRVELTIYVRPKLVYIETTTIAYVTLSEQPHAGMWV